MVALSSSPLPPDIHAWFRSELRPHEPAVRRFLRHRFTSLPDHDDLVQEAYLSLFRLYQRRPIPNPRATFLLVVRNLALDRLRHRAYRQRYEVDTATAPEVPCSHPDARTHAGTTDLHHLLGSAIAQLSPRCREVLNLQRRERLTFREIGARLGIAGSTASSLHTTAVRRCAAFFAERGITPR